MKFRSNIAIAAMFLSPLALSACGSEAPAPEEVVAVPGLSASDGRLMLPAVGGNPAAVYATLAMAEDAGRGVAINRVSVEKAESAALHEYVEYDFQNQMVEMMQLTLQPGESEALEPGGRHIMAMKLADDVKEGDTLEVTLTVAGGDTFSFPVQVMAAGAER